MQNLTKGDLIIYEDEKVIAFLDIHPSRNGHTLIIPKTHITAIVIYFEISFGKFHTLLT